MAADARTARTRGQTLLDPGDEIRCEDSKWSQSRPPPGLIQAAARRILNFHSDDQLPFGRANHSRARIASGDLAGVWPHSPRHHDRTAGTTNAPTSVRRPGVSYLT